MEFKVCFKFVCGPDTFSCYIMQEIFPDLTGFWNTSEETKVNVLLSYNQPLKLII